MPPSWGGTQGGIQLALVRDVVPATSEKIGAADRMSNGLWWGVVLVSFAAGYGFMRWAGMIG
jgi:hypothetical protein